MSYVELARARSGSSKSGSGTDSGRSSPRARTPLGEPAHDAISFLKQLIEERKEDLAVDAEFQQLTSLICASFTDIGVSGMDLTLSATGRDDNETDHIPHLGPVCGVR